MIKVLHATPELIRTYYGSDRPRSMRALVAVRDGEVLGVLGMYPINGQQLVFLDMKDELRKHPRVLVDGAKTFMRWAREAKMPVCAWCDHTIPAAKGFLEHFGFREHYKGVYKWTG